MQKKKELSASKNDCRKAVVFIETKGMLDNDRLQYRKLGFCSK